MASLAARWLAKRLDAGLSERRAVQGLAFAGGVPTALRGLHAWFGHFAPRMTEACIGTDPYGALRYGDLEQLSLPHARLLIQSLAALADEDPHFRRNSKIAFSIVLTVENPSAAAAALSP
jgi:hypothetical protein